MSDFESKKKENHQNFAGNPFLRVRKIQKIQKYKKIQKNTKNTKKYKNYKKNPKNPKKTNQYVRARCNSAWVTRPERPNKLLVKLYF